MKLRVEGVIPLMNFYKMKTKLEKFIYLVTPIFWGVTSYIFISHCYWKVKTFKMDIFFSDYINALITVIALFVSFTMAYLSILVTSSSKNIEEIKATTSEKYQINKKPVYLFQILVTDLTYSIFAESFLLILLFIQKFIVIIASNIVLNIALSMDIILLAHIIYILIRNIKNIYFTFWKSV